MSDLTRVNFEKLNGNNFSVWKFKMELLLIKEELWDVISEDVPVEQDATWKKRNGKAKAFIGLMVEDNQLGHVKKAKNAKEAWNNIVEYHEKGTLSSKVYLLRKICDTKLRPSGNMEEHILEILKLVEQLEAMGESLAEHLVVAMILSSLPEKYNTLITALESRPEEDLKLEFIKGKLIDEYKRNHEMFKADEDLAMKSKYLHNRNLIPENIYRKTPNRNIFCNYCKKSGHLKSQCRILLNRGDRKQYSKVSQVEEEPDESNEEEDICFLSRENIEEGNEWIIDSGATSHMSSDITIFENFIKRESKVRIANGDVVYSKGVGNARIWYHGNKLIQIKLENVLYVPHLDGNIISVNQIMKKGFQVQFINNMCEIKRRGIVVATAELRNNMFVLPIIEKALTAKNHNSNCLHSWHRKLGHRDPVAIKKIIDKKLGNNIDISCCGIHGVCTTCLEGKLTRKSFSKESEKKSSEVLDLIHSDLCGPMQTETPSKKRYLMTMIDDYSRYTVIYLLRNKYETFEKIKEYVSFVKNFFRRSPKIIRADQGGEYTGNDLIKYLKEEGIQIQYSVADSPQQNGVAERKNRSLLEMARCMLFDAKLPKKYWGEAINYANDVQNRLPTLAVNETPFQIWRGEKPDFADLQLFGSEAFVLIPPNKRRKLEVKSRRLLFVGLAQGMKAYRFLDISTDKIIISRDVKFIDSQNEEIISIDENQKEKEGSNEVEIVLSNEATDDGPEKEKELPSHQLDTISDENGSIEGGEWNLNKKEENHRKGDENTDLLRRSNRIKTKKYEKTLKANLTPLEPTSYEEAIVCEDREKWIAAMNEEMISIDENKTWELAELPEHRKAIGCKWVYKIKQGANNEITQYKARLVAQGYSQKFGEDYDAVFAPVVKQTTLRILLTIAGRNEMKLRHLDVKTAFLNGNLEEIIFMKQPKGYVVQGKEKFVLRLKKSLYGLKQAARSWNMKINSILIENGFSRSNEDLCFYRKQVNGANIFLIIYVDDVIIGSKREEEIDKAENLLGQYFKLTSLGNLNYYLGINIEKEESGIYSMNQKGYIEKIIERFNLKDAKNSKIPLDPGYFKSREEEQTEFPDPTIYQSLIGMILYLAVNTRPDISVSTSILGRSMSKPNKTDWNEAKRVVKYLKMTKDFKLYLGQTTEEQILVGYSDADWAGDKNDRKSNSGFLFKLFGSCISWMSRKQQCVTLSSTEAEYVALAEAAQEAVWLKRILEDFGVFIENQIIIYEDNQSCLKLILNEQSSRRSKHIDTKYHFLKDLKNELVLNYEYCPSNYMIADALTKPLEVTKLNRFRELMGLR